MVSETKKSPPNKSKDILTFKEDDMSPKGKTKHTVEPDWPTKDSIPEKRRKIKRTTTSRLP